MSFRPVAISLLIWYLSTVIIIIMEICKAPTQRLKSLNKHPHIMYIEMENVISNKNVCKKKKRKS